MDIDPELLDLGRQHVAAEYGVGPHAARLEGRSLAELRLDAAKLRSEIGLPPLDDGRDARGRFKSKPKEPDGRAISAMIRRAAGRAA